MNSWVVFFWRSSNSRWPTDGHIWSKPILGHDSVLDWNIDFKICVLVPQNKKPMTFCWGCLIQDGGPHIYFQNLFWAITWYWIEILTSNFVCWYLKIKTYEFLSRSSNSRWLTDRHIWSEPNLGHNLVLDWDIDFKFSALVPQNEQLSCFLKVWWPTDRHI